MDGQAFHPEKARGTAADFLARIAGRTLSAEKRAEAVRLAPPVEVLRFEDPLYLPLMHVTDSSGSAAPMDSVAIIIINRDRPDLTDAVVEQVRSMRHGLDTQLFVVEAGSRLAGLATFGVLRL